MLLHKLWHESHRMNAVVSKKSDHRERAEQNDRRVRTDKAALHMTHGATTLGDHVSNRMQKSIYHANVEDFPQAFSRTCINRIDDGCIVYFINLVFVFEYARHRQ